MSVSVSKDGLGKTLYIEVSVYPNGQIKWVTTVS